MRVVLASCATACAIACAHPPVTPARTPVTGCLDLPGAHRYNLRLGPDGQRLYWTEWTRYHGYDESWPRSALAAWPIDAPASAAITVTEQIDGLFRVLPDGRVVGLRSDAGVVMWDHGGAELVSLAGDMDHLELLDDHTVVYALNASIWIQPLHRTAARWLAHADELVGVDGQAVLIRRDDRLLRVDVATGAERALPAPPGQVLKALAGAVISSTDTGLAVQRGGSSKAEEVLAGDDWITRSGPDAVRAWRKAATGDVLEVALIDSAGAARLPPVTGAIAVEGVVRIPDGRIAYLVAHDTDRNGDHDGEDETDLCLAPAGATALVVPSRAAPRRLLPAVPALDAAAVALGATSWTVVGQLELPRVTFRGVPARADQQARWRDARAATTAVTAAVGDPTIKVEIDYVDGRSASSHWWPISRRRTAMAGLGGVLAPDPADYDVAIDEVALARQPDGAVTCAGTITNLTDRPLDALEVDCVDSREDALIPVDPSSLRPGATGQFTGTTTAGADDRLAISVHQGPGRFQLAHAEKSFPSRRQRLVDAAVEIADRTRLRYWDWTDDGEAFVVTLDGPDDFATWSDAARELAAGTAYDLVRRLDRAIFDAPTRTPAPPLRLTIRSGDRRWLQDDAGLTEAGDE